MTARLLGAIVFLLTPCVSFPQANAVPGQMQTAVTVEPLGPKASPAIEKMLNEASRLAEAKQALDSLKTADQALEAAHQANDAAGTALAEQARARALQDLQRTDEAMSAWQEEAQIWAATGDTPEEITALVQAGRLCVPDKKSEAERLFAQGLSVSKVKSDRPRAVAQALHDSGIALSDGISSHRIFSKPVDEGQKQMAWEYLSAALALQEKQTPESLALVETLNALAKVELDRGQDLQDRHGYSLAKDDSARAAEIGQRRAPDSPIVVESLVTLARSEHLLSFGDDSARLHYVTALRIQKKLAPGGSVEEVDVLTGLGGLETDKTNYPAAREYYQEAVSMGERLAPESKEFAYSLICLGVLELNENSPAAHGHLLRALAISEELHANLGLGYSLMYLGNVADGEADLASARNYFERALATFQETSPNSSAVPLALANLGREFEWYGDLVSALEYSRRALAITEQKNPVSFDTANNLLIVGGILREQGNLDAAAGYLSRSLAIWEKINPESLNVARTLNILAWVARSRGNSALAAEYDRRALEMGAKSCPNYWCVVNMVTELGELAYELGDLSASEGYLLHAMDIIEQTVGPRHPDLARNLNDLALTSAAQGKTTEALADALRAERISAEHLRLSVRTLSERQALAYEGIRASGLDLALTLVEGRPSARSEVFDVVIRSRALVFDELAARHRSAYGSGDPEVKQLAEQLSSARTRLATLVFRGVGDSEPEAYRKLLDGTRDQMEKAERMLAERSLAFRQDQLRAQLGLKGIAASLPQGAALVAFVRYVRHDLQKPGAGKAPPEPIPSYAAFVLRAGEHEPEFVRLGSAQRIERLLASWRRNIAQEAEVTDIRANAGEAAYRRVGAAFRRKIWDPLQPALGHANEVFVVPDAALHLVNLASLPVGSSQYLIERGPLIHYLSTERDLVPVSSRHGEGILVVGNPAFDQATKVVMAANNSSAPAPTTAGPEGTVLRSTRSACGAFQTLRFSPLPASQQEAENIAALWQKSTAREDAGTLRGAALQSTSGELLQVRGAEASVEAFEQDAPGKRVLHVATHGFFLEDSCESAVQRKLDAGKREETFLPATAENPLLLSGLAFAGANRRASARPDDSDGILTAEEIAGINLEGVDWAVLSACDTGVGEIKVGEGVFGLRRAFQVAGAKTVIMSLWPVEDETTRQWMGTLYREHFLDGNDTVKSVRAASLQILRQRRAKHESTHPFYWGAFIAAGDWH